MNTLQAAYEQGVNLIDTADIYQDGMSEHTVGKFLKGKKDKVFVVTKCGRKLNPHVSAGYNEENIVKFVDASLKNMDVDSLIWFCFTVRLLKYTGIRRFFMFLIN